MKDHTLLKWSLSLALLPIIMMFYEPIIHALKNDIPDIQTIVLGLLVIAMALFPLINMTNSIRAILPFNTNNTTKIAATLEEISSKIDRTENISKEEKRKDALLNISNISFYFAHKERIKNFYKTYFNEAILNSLTSETSGDQKGEIQGNIKFLGITLGKSKTNKLTSTYKFDETTLETMFIRYQREMLKTDQVKIIPEEIDYNKSELQAFDNIIEDIRQKYNLTLDKEEIEKRRNELKMKSIENVLASLENLSGWVLIEGKFTIELEDQNYKCTYDHPINNYLPTQVTPITISMTIPAQALEDHIKAHFARSTNTQIPLTVYAKVWHSINRNKNIWNIDLDPLAIY